MAETLIMPGGIDIHAHLREPGNNPAETIASGTRAALLGGFVVVADMPNNPGMPVWTEGRLREKVLIADETAYIPTLFYAGSQPESDNIGELEAMARVPQAVGLKLYGDPTTGNDQTYEASDFREIAAEWHRVAPRKPIMFHSGRHNLADMIGMVAGDQGHHLHVCHVNSPEQVDLVVDAKERGWPVTAGVTPHHLLMTSHDRMTRGTFAEMQPPLARQIDTEKLMLDLEAGDIDVIETDFAPHTVQAKMAAEHSGGHCYGVPGIEHAIPLLLYQVHKGNLTQESLERAIHTRPAEILGIRIDRPGTQVTWNVDIGAYRIGERDVEAQCGWTPYLGMLAIGEPDTVIVHNTHLVVKGEPLGRREEVVMGPVSD